MRMKLERLNVREGNDNKSEEEILRNRSVVKET